MIILIIILIMLAIVLAIALAVSLKSRKDSPSDDNQYLNKDGDHVYYNESIIEKKQFHRINPHEDPRSLERLFKNK